jgi:hypothetical protein
MVSFQWLRTTYTEDNFHILACLLAKVSQQQDPDEVIEDSAQTAITNDDDHQDDNATIAPQTLVREHGTERLKAAFLDRLAEFMAAISPGGRGTGDDKTAKAKDICATALQIVDGGRRRVHH